MVLLGLPLSFSSSVQLEGYVEPLHAHVRHLCSIPPLSSPHGKSSPYCGYDPIHVGVHFFGVGVLEIYGYALLLFPVVAPLTSPDVLYRGCRSLPAWPSLMPSLHKQHICNHPNISSLHQQPQWALEVDPYLHIHVHVPLEANARCQGRDCS